MPVFGIFSLVRGITRADFDLSEHGLGPLDEAESFFNVRSLASQFLKTFDEYERLLFDVVSARLGPQAARRLNLRDQVLFLREMQLLKPAEDKLWSACLGVRLRELVEPADHRPQQSEIADALDTMNELQSAMVATLHHCRAERPDELLLIGIEGIIQ